MIVGRLEMKCFSSSTTAFIVKHYNDTVKKQIDLDEDDIYHLEFIIKEIKRKLDLK